MAWTDGIEQRVTLNAPLAVVRRAVNEGRWAAKAANLKRHVDGA